MERLGEQDMKTKRPVAKDRINECFKWLIGYVPKLFSKTIAVCWACTMVLKRQRKISRKMKPKRKIRMKPMKNLRKTKEYWKKLTKLCGTWFIKSWYWWLRWSSQNAGQRVNWDLANGNKVYKDNYDIMCKMKEACKISYYVKP